MVLIGSLFLRFWDKVFVPSSRAHQDMKSVIGQGTAGKFMGSSQFQRAKLVVVRQGEANMWANGHCEAARWAWGMKIGKRKGSGGTYHSSFQSPFYPLTSEMVCSTHHFTSSSSLPFFP